MLNPRLQPFEYMHFAKNAPRGARIALTVSGMTPPPIEWLGDPGKLMDLTDAGSAGTEPLRERIAHRYRVRPDEVFVTPGASAAIHLVAAALCVEGHDALCERPVYPPLWLEPEFFGARVRFVERRVESRYSLEPKDLDYALTFARRPSVFFFTNLHNPTGTVIPEGDLVGLCQASLAAGARPACCELYADFLGAARPRSVAELVKGAISIGSVTKAFGLGALRVGWILCQDVEFIERIDAIFNHMDVNCAMPSLRAAEAALDHAAKFEERALATATAGRAVFDAWARAERAKGRIQCADPAGGIIAFPRILRVDDTKALARRIRDRHGVQLTPGEYFSAPGSFRIGFGGDPKLTAEGLEALSAEMPT